MPTVDDAFDDLASGMGLPDLPFDASGNLTLVFNDTLPLNVATIDAHTVEFWVTLPDVAALSSIAALRALLEANHLGEGTGSARLALQPNGGGAVLCERVDVSDLSREDLEARLLAFVKMATFWTSRDGTAAVSGQGGEAIPANADGEMMFRV